MERKEGGKRERGGRKRRGRRGRGMGRGRGRRGRKEGGRGGRKEGREEGERVANFSPLEASMTPFEKYLFIPGSKGSSSSEKNVSVKRKRESEN